MIYYTKQKPTEPGWYWCRNDALDEPWEACVRVDQTPAGLVCSWMTAPGQADTLHETNWSPHAYWAAITPPVVLLG